MKIACISYRDWALEIYDELEKKYFNKHTFLIIRSKDDFNSSVLKKFKPDLILWYGWSWFVDKEFTNNFNSIMLHPSPLPKYRGGSPIQNQIINGEKYSAVTLFKMTEKLDDGDIFFQTKFSLAGTLKDIFSRIKEIGFVGTCNIIEGNYNLRKQDNSKSSYFKRRSPIDSEITKEELETKSAEYLYNKIRMLADPYPNAFIVTVDGKKLFITHSRIE